MGRIRILPDQLINQIAAGEVIERPASVVKELLENALDAGARHIGIEIEGGGRQRIRVADDGEGLEPDDALVAFERHATSKLAGAADLSRIATLGFRGEALPSIASVSRLTMTTARDTQTGFRVEIEGGRILKAGEAAHPRGTTVDVRDLFFNTPARGKFLKSSATEMGHISDLVAAYAVALPAVRISLLHEGRRILEALPCDDEAERARQLFGDEWARALPVHCKRGGLTLRGILAPPEAAAASRRMQYFYVNGRFIKDRLIAHAVAAAHEEVIPRGRHAAVLLFIECPPGDVDVNVHPAKAEVRFANPRAVHDLVQQSIKQAVTEGLPITRLDDPLPAQQTASSARGDAWSARAVGEPSCGFQERRREELTGLDEAPQPAAEVTGGWPYSNGIQEARLHGGVEALGHFRESYILAADDGGLLIIDQHAAHERILYEELLGREAVPSARERQRLLFPVTVIPPRPLRERLREVCDELEGLGFPSEPFGDDTLIVREAPAAVAGGDLTRLLSDLLEQMLDGLPQSPSGTEIRRQKLLATIACHAAIKVRMPLTPEKMNYLIKELFRTAAPMKCPHGRPAILRFSLEQIEKGFYRR